MEPIVRSNHHVRFRAFSLDPQTRELFRNGVKQKIYGQPIELLLVLIAHPGELVTRETLQKALWPGDTFVDFEHSLNSTIKRLRQALGDDPASPLFIETVPRLGYRFVAPVQPPDATVPATAPSQASEPDGRAPTMPSTDEGARMQPLSAKARRTPVWLMAGVVVLLLAAAAIWYTRRPLPVPHFTDYLQLTNDGREKHVRGTDGSNLILQLISPAGVALMPISGGPITPIQIDLPNAAQFPEWGPSLTSVSPDGSKFLVGGHYDAATGFDTWVVGSQGRPARYLVQASRAYWSPDGKSVAYCTPHGDIYAIAAEGGEPRLLAASPLPAGQFVQATDLRWSPDGTRIRFVWHGSYHTRYWEVSAKGTGLHEVFPGWNPSDVMCCGRWTPDGDFFLFITCSDFREECSAGAPIWVKDERRNWLRRPVPEPVQMTAGPTGWWDLFMSPDGKRVFADGITVRGELVIHDRGSSTLIPYLGGISAEFVSFSSDGRYLVYVTFPEGVMWRANRDGTGLMQLTQPPIHPKQMRWSPDGSQILFVDRSSSGLNAIYVIPSQGGMPSRLLPDDADVEGSPDWSPDGKKIVFSRNSLSGASYTTAAAACIVDLPSRKATTISLGGGRPFWSERWSPDGRYLVGLTEPVDDLELIDLKAGQASLLRPQQGTISNLSWSHDGQFIYFLAGDLTLQQPGIHEPGVYRFPVTGGRAQKVVDLRGFRHTGSYRTWMGLDPDDRPILLRDEGTNEIYALTLERR